MKKKIKIILSVIAVLLLVVFVVAVNMPKGKLKAVKASEGLSERPVSDKEMQTIKTGNVMIENDEYSMQLNCETTHFTILHKPSGTIYSSVSDPASEQEFEIGIHYYDSNSAKTSMNSYEDSVQKSTYEVKTNGEVIQVDYSIQKAKQRLFVPEVIGQEVFEEEILKNLESGPRRRIKQFYHLSEENVYILSDMVAEHNYSEITTYMDTAGFTEQAYTKELERLGMEDSVDNKQSAAFVIPVQYALSEDGFIATVLTDKITSASDSYQLTDVSVLPYFGSCGASEKGWMLVPDGSGAIIELAEKRGSTYEQKIWGNDLAVASSVSANMTQNAGMPVYGMHTGEQAHFALISGGAATATINAEIYGKEFAQSRIYTEFNILSFDTSDAGELSRKAEFNLYASDYMEEHPQITYTLFPDATTTYSDMAVWYREYLVAKGILSDPIEMSDKVPIYIDFIGYETIEQSVLGISTEKEIVLSDLKGIQSSLKELKSRGVNNVQVRLKAYSNGGLYGSVAEGYNLHKCVGSQEELDALAKSIKDGGGKLYLENNISTAYTSGKVFDKMTHAVRNITKMVAEGVDFDLIARTRVEAVKEYYLTSPAYFSALTEKFIMGLGKKSEDMSLYGYSWSDYGSKLWSDFHEEHPYDRTQTVEMSQKAVKQATDVFDKIITDGSNAYVLSDTVAVMNIPLSASSLHAESYSVPFYQMVIHGYLDYAGAPMNCSADTQKNYLASIESGACLYYSFYTENGNPLTETEAGTLVYPTQISASMESVEQQYAEWTKIFLGLRDQLIMEHRRLAEDVTVTVYEDGTMIYVNYNEKEIQLEGVTIPSKGFFVKERGQS